ALPVKRVVAYALCLVFLVALFQGCKILPIGRPDSLADDRAIVTRIRTLIAEDPALNPSAIRVFAVEGKVTLSGPVPDGHAKSRLLAKAKGVKGVKSVSE